LKEIIVILLCTFKFAMTFPLAVITFRFTFLETLLWTNIGGAIGIYLFAHLSEELIGFWKREFSRATVNRKTVGNLRRNNEKKKVFSRRSRRIVHIRGKYGLPGIALITPLLLSIPVGVFIVVRYFGKNKFRFMYLIAGNFIWSLIYATFYGYSYGFVKEILAGL
jgi:hypothetical protein